MLHQLPLCIFMGVKNLLYFSSCHIGFFYVPFILTQELQVLSYGHHWNWVFTQIFFECLIHANNHQQYQQQKFDRPKIQIHIGMFISQNRHFNKTALQLLGRCGRCYAFAIQVLHRQRQLRFINLAIRGGPQHQPAAASTYYYIYIQQSQELMPLGEIPA